MEKINFLKTHQNRYAIRRIALDIKKIDNI